jgi:hypothetical protein
MIDEYASIANALIDAGSAGRGSAGERLERRAYFDRWAKFN